VSVVLDIELASADDAGYVVWDDSPTGSVLYAGGPSMLFGRGDDAQHLHYDAVFMFRGVTVPVGSSLISAYVDFVAQSDQGDTPCNVIAYTPLWRWTAESEFPQTADDFWYLTGGLQGSAVLYGVGAWTIGSHYQLDILSLIGARADYEDNPLDGSTILIRITDASSAYGAIREPRTWVASPSGTNATLHIEYEPPEPDPLVAPGDLVAEATSSSQIILSWDDNSLDEDSFSVERSADGSTGWAEIDSVESDTEAYVDSGLDPQTPYYYRVRAYRESDDSYSSYSNVASATTDAVPPPFTIDDDPLTPQPQNIVRRSMGYSETTSGLEVRSGYRALEASYNVLTREKMKRLRDAWKGATGRVKVTYPDDERPGNCSYWASIHQPTYSGRLGPYYTGVSVIFSHLEDA
jgi:hypothetical protein